MRTTTLLASLIVGIYGTGVIVASLYHEYMVTNNDIAYLIVAFSSVLGLHILDTQRMIWEDKDE
jgi:hypothetical protein